MIDYYLKTTTRQELRDALAAASLAVVDHFEHDEEGNPLDEGIWRLLDGVNLDEIGTIYRPATVKTIGTLPNGDTGVIDQPTGELDDDGNPVLEAVPGFHANLRLVDIEPQGPLPVIPVPDNPARVWL